jgi:ankyrin repeat protein
VTSDGKTALIHAAEANNSALVKRFCESGCDINRYDKTGKTALHYACVAESSETAEFLIDLPEIDLVHRDNDGNTPLHLIAEHGQLVLFVKLLEKGAKLDFNGQNLAKSSPMHLMCRHGHSEMLPLLLKQPRIDNSVRDSQGQTALHTAARFEHVDACRLLLDLDGLEVNSRDVDGVCFDKIGRPFTTPLGMAVLTL